MTAHGYLESLAPFGMKLGLERITALLEHLDDPQERLDAIHVVGTNGKSSTVRFAAAALTASGLRTGAYLSPHVTGWDERVQIDGRPIGPGAFALALDRVQDAAREVEREHGEGPTQFEALTAVALLVLAEAGVETCVVEAGLGGRHDATRVMRARVVGLTNVGLDHQRVLGETREEILAEKVAVLEPGAVLCVGVVDDELYARAASLAGAAGAGCERIAAGAGDALPLPGAYLRDNAAHALRLSELLLAPGTLKRTRAVASLAAAIPPGRLEVIAGEPLVLLDGAHNAEGAAALVRELDGALGERRPRVGVLALQEDKPLAAILAAFAPVLDALVATTSAHTGHSLALPAEELAAAALAAGFADVAAEPDPLAALTAARARAGPAGAVVVAGSLYLLERLRTAALEAR
ncbi:MAG: dihydrofolate synthase / folylpolyglutamate synthase [Gaiellales bacterium]|nr:dihydrofolate synthase / folylpolyglutamate synthase [Gaiellales bacterium]